MKRVYDIMDLDCPVCANNAQIAISKIEGIKSCSVSLMISKITVDYEDGADIKRIEQEIAKTIKKVTSGASLKL